MDKTTLLRTIEQARADFVSCIAPLNEEQLCRPTLDGQWSVKDILVHRSLRRRNGILRLYRLCRRRFHRLRCWLSRGSRQTHALECPASGILCLSPSTAQSRALAA